MLSMILAYFSFSVKRLFRIMDEFEISGFEESIQEGNVEKFIRLSESCDVNQNFGHKRDEYGYSIYEKPLSVSLQNIKSENDEWFQISQLLLDHRNIDVNAECGAQNYKRCILLYYDKRR